MLSMFMCLCMCLCMYGLLFFKVFVVVTYFKVRPRQSIKNEYLSLTMEELSCMHTGLNPCVLTESDRDPYSYTRTLSETFTSTEILNTSL